MNALTESEARGRWCPQAMMVDQTTAHGEPPVNRNTYNQPMGTCIASQCMCWRWLPLPPAADISQPRAGYCGLAGRPE